MCAVFYENKTHCTFKIKHSILPQVWPSSPVKYIYIIDLPKENCTLTNFINNVSYGTSSVHTRVITSFVPIFNPL